MIARHTVPRAKYSTSQALCKIAKAFHKTRQPVKFLVQITRCLNETVKAAWVARRLDKALRCAALRGR